MADINRDDDDSVEIAYPPRFTYGERVIARSVKEPAARVAGPQICWPWMSRAWRPSCSCRARALPSGRWVVARVILGFMALWACGATEDLVEE